MLVALTGGTGFVGSHTAVALLEAGHRVRLLVRDASKLKRVFDSRGVVVDDFLVGDVTDPATVDQLLAGCDAVVHAAAVVALEAARANEVRDTNERSVELVVGGAARRGLRPIVYVSSAGALFTPGGPPLHGDSPVGVTSTAYGESKARAERYVRGLQQAGAPILTVYPTGVIGPDDPGLTEANRALSIFLDLVAPVTTSGYQPVDVRDLARLHVVLVESGLHVGRYMAAGEYAPWNDLYDRVERLTGRRLRRVPMPAMLLRGAGRIADVVKRVAPFDLPLTLESMLFATRWPTADASATERDLNVRFRDLDETLRDTYRWLFRAGHLTERQIGKLAE
jgi:nucleoside-diphosphate-sugar epimerase